MSNQPYTCELPLRPVPKERHRGGRRAYTPPRTRDFEAAVAAAYNGPTFDCPLRADLRFDTDLITVTFTPMIGSQRPKHVRGDVDNLTKSVLDGLQPGAFGNDSLIHALGVTLAPRGDT